MKGIEGTEGTKAGKVYLRQINRNEEIHYHVVKTVNTLHPRIDEVLLEEEVNRLINSGFNIEVQRAKV